MGKQDTPTDPKKSAAPSEHHAPKQAPPAPRGAVGQKVGCAATGCRDKDVRYNFCEEHFRQFKFGLITKSGERVLDYERKLEHYQHWLKEQKISKVA